MSEYKEQTKIFEWYYSKYTMGLHPIENAKGIGRGPAGSKYASGVPDMFLAVPIPPHHGLYLELKHGRNKLQPKQLDWLRYLTNQGYVTAVAWGHMAAIQIIKNYLMGEYAQEETIKWKQ